MIIAGERLAGPLSRHPHRHLNGKHVHLQILLVLNRALVFEWVRRAFESLYLIFLASEILSRFKVQIYFKVRLQ